MFWTHFTLNTLKVCKEIFFLPNCAEKKKKSVLQNVQKKSCVKSVKNLILMMENAMIVHIFFTTRQNTNFCVNFAAVITIEKIFPKYNHV